ncbi:MAG: preprotein translocase subunit SecY [Candidatus Nanohaloarchaeota archaeon]|nr:preprotein translocase subunit SecY [Candidatus Nanohaloarchaeota archaeon]
MGLEGIMRFIPSVSVPQREVAFKERLLWTLLALLVYFGLTEVPVIGLDVQAESYFAQVSAILGASLGKLAMLGIGPIVTASIILQLLAGSGILNIDLNTHQGRAWFQGMQKLLALIFSFLEAGSLVLLGNMKASSPEFVKWIILQIALGAIIIIYLDELVSRWGIGSGVSLFILASVSKQLFIRTFDITRTLDGKFVGIIPDMIRVLMQGGAKLSDILSYYIIPLAVTVVIFLVVVYAQSLRIEVPLVMSSFRGFGRKWPLKFIYTSNMPVILASALLINLRLFGSILSSKGIYILGKFNEYGYPESGLLYYLTPPNNFLINLIHWNLTATDVVRAVLYLIFFVILSVIFSVFWMITSGMGPADVARQIINAGMQIPGFRRDPRVIERVLERYIPPLTVLGGAFVGLLAAFADIFSALVSGTGLLLAVMIAHNMYEQIMRYNLEAMPSLMRRLISKS